MVTRYAVRRGIRNGKHEQRLYPPLPKGSGDEESELIEVNTHHLEQMSIPPVKPVGMSLPEKIFPVRHGIGFSCSRSSFFMPSFSGRRLFTIFFWPFKIIFRACLPNGLGGPIFGGS